MVKVYGLRDRLAPRRQSVSDTIQDALVEVFGMPREKRAHRFFLLEREDIFAPPDRSDDYVLIEITAITGRQKETKKALVQALFRGLSERVGIAPQDVEVVILEAPGENWGFRGQHGDEAALSYSIQK